jgi:hypothetical protein
VSAAIAVHPDHIADDVLKAARQALLDYFSFDRRDLGGAVHLSDVYRVLQEAPGVVAADVNRLMFKRPAGVTDAEFEAYLRVHGVLFHTVGGTEVPDELQPHLRIGPSELALIEAPQEDVAVEDGMPVGPVGFGGEGVSHGG